LFKVRPDFDSSQIKAFLERAKVNLSAREMAGRVIGFRCQGEVAMNRSDDGLDRINTQSDQLEGAILERDGGTDKQRPAAIYALEVGWAPGRRPTPSSSFKSNLSVIAASAKLIVFIGVIAILYFGRPVFVRLAVAILLAFILAPLVRVLRRWRFGRIPSIIIVVLLAFLTIFGLGMLLGEQVTHLAAALPKYQDTLTQKIDALRGATGEEELLERPRRSFAT
jgi:AI-2E family transporter